MRSELALTSSSDQGNVELWDLRSGTPLMSYKGNKGERNGVELVAGKYFFSTQNDKPALHVWVWQRDQPHMKFSLPEKMSALAVSPRGIHCVGGSTSGKIHVWEVATGELVKIFDGHYGKINVLRFTDDGMLLLSGGEDASVNVWDFGSLLNESVESVSALFSWSDHSLAVTDIYVGLGGNHARVVTSSLDCSCKVWDLSRGTLLSTLIFPVYINCVVMDPCEYKIFAGGGSGDIFIAELYQHSSKIGYVPIQQTHAIEKKSSSLFLGHRNAVTSLSVSFDGTILLSGSEDCKAIVWDIQCRQMLRSFTSHKGTVNFVKILPHPPVDLHSTELSPNLPPISQFKRFPKIKGNVSNPSNHPNPNNPNTSHSDDVTIRLTPVNNKRFREIFQNIDTNFDIEFEHLSKKHGKTKSLNEEFVEHDAGKVEQLQKEIEKLTNQNSKLLRLNEDLYHFTVNQLTKELEQKEKERLKKKPN